VRCPPWPGRCAGVLGGLRAVPGAYAEARKVIEDAGEIAKWMEWVAKP
jgi:hypothetical protein